MIYFTYCLLYRLIIVIMLLLGETLIHNALIRLFIKAMHCRLTMYALIEDVV